MNTKMWPCGSKTTSTDREQEGCGRDQTGIIWKQEQNHDSGWREGGSSTSKKVKLEGKAWKDQPTKDQTSVSGFSYPEVEGMREPRLDRIEARKEELAL